MVRYVRPRNQPFSTLPPSIHTRTRHTVRADANHPPQTPGTDLINVRNAATSSHEAIFSVGKLVFLPCLIHGAQCFLSHVNKCHPEHKEGDTGGGNAQQASSTSTYHHTPSFPIPDLTLTPGRRKGISASRATTSKQACDQCVQNSLPCDGCNPCAKCVQRKVSFKLQ